MKINFSEEAWAEYLYWQMQDKKRSRESTNSSKVLTGMEHAGNW